MKFSQKMSVAAAGAALVAGLIPGVARADAVAQSILDVTNFSFGLGNNAAGSLGAGSLLGSLSSANANTTADAFAKLVGVGSDTGSAIAGGQQAAVGQTGFYAPGTRLLGAPVATYAGSRAIQAGDALTSTSSAKVDNTVSLHPTGDGTAQGNVNLNGEFQLMVATPGTKIEVAFDAEAWLRAMLTDKGTATASYSWTITLSDADDNQVFSWQPNGLAGGIFGGTEYADGFNMTDSISRLSNGQTTRTRALAHFEAETDALAAGLYTVSIRHTGTADAKLLPEPGSLALLGVALFGAAAVTRRRISK